ncbi:MAG TPA: DUF2325 domain-containing protein [Candidatus Sulfotelmatobacter sp.]|nr:DUF2325 domain-containing protein [Candidatus Sulfotelmatobacter sp.]
MCESCTDDTVAPTKAGRRKLWEIESGWHCMIIGTCVNMSELRRLAAKFGMQSKNVSASDYEIHSTVVHWAAQDRRVGKEIHKLLDRKYAQTITRFSKIRDVEGLTAAWREALERGEVAGAVWGVMTHPAISADLQTLVFGEMHMLSHQVGAASRVELRRIHLLEKEKVELEAKVSRQQERLRQEVSSRDAIIRDLRDQLDCERGEVRRLAHASEGAAELDRLKALVSELQRHLELGEAGRRLADGQVHALDGLLAESEILARRLQSEVGELRAENASLEIRVLGIGSGDQLAGCDQSCASLDLCGRCILYVGGRANHVPHLRRIVEGFNGSLVHHDGGFEESMGRLNGLLGQADAVMFPVDCVSHMAHDQLKRLCKRWDKPFVPVRRSGVGAFLRALETVGGE